MKTLLKLSYITAVITIVPVAPAHAYLDAASVSMALQVVTGAVASVLLFGRHFLYKITSVFRKKSPDAVVAATEAGDDA